MKNGKILSEQEYTQAKVNAAQRGKLEELFLKSETKNDSVIYTTRITIIPRDENGVFFDPFAEPKKILNKHFPIESFRDSAKQHFPSTFLSGKPTFINFWFTNCIPCVAEIPLLNSLKERYGEKVNFIAITFENKEAVEAFLKKRAIDFNHITDSKLQLDKLNYTSYPTNLILDKDGKVKHVFGEISDSEDDLALIIDDLIK